MGRIDIKQYKSIEHYESSKPTDSSKNKAEVLKS